MELGVVGLSIMPNVYEVEEPVVVSPDKPFEAGIVDTFSTQYATPIEPTTNSSYVTALFSNTATHSYPISLSGVPTGTGFYQQLLTVNNPSSYGINKAVT